MAVRISLKTAIRQVGGRTIPLKKLKYTNPVAAHLRREMGKEYRVITFAGRKRGSFKKYGVESVIFPKNFKEIEDIESSPGLRIKESLLIVKRDPKEKSLIIQVNSRFKDKKYATEAVTKAKKVVEEVLQQRGIKFSKEYNENSMIYKTGKYREFVSYHR